RVYPVDVVAVERGAELALAVERAVAYEVVAARARRCLEPDERDERREDDFLGRPEPRAAHDVAQLLVLEDRDEASARFCGEDGGRPERPVWELRLAVRETAQERAPEVELAKRGNGRADARRPRLDSRGVAEHPHARLSPERRGDPL